MIVLEIDEPTPSLNRAQGSHWNKRHRLRKRWGWLIRAAVLAAKVHEPPRLTRAAITIERYGARLLDDENLRAGAKPMMDAIVAEGLIVDDNPNVIGSPSFRQIVGKARKTIVRISAL